MVGITIDANGETYIVSGSFDSGYYIEGNLYYHPETKQLFYYSKTEKRSNPTTGFYPIWDGENTYVTKYSIKEYYPKDVMKIDTTDLVKDLSASKAHEIVQQQQRSMSAGPLSFQITDEDNFFTQCIKEILNQKEYTLVDLIQMTKPSLSEKVLSNYCNALSKISFMRLDKWHIWLHNILHLSYGVTIYHDDRKIISFKEPNEFEVVGPYDKILKSKMDPFKKLIKVTMLEECIDKSDLRGDGIDEYTINNMMTILTGTKPVSAQLFSRFIRMAGLSFQMDVYEKDQIILTYRE